MKKLIIIPVALLVIIPVILLTGQDFSISVKGLAVSRSGPAEYTASFAVKYSGLAQSMIEDTSVPVQREKFHICGQVTDGTVREDDFLYAGMSLDLNGDGDTADSYRLTKTRGVSYLGDAPLKVIVSPYTFNTLTVYDFSGSADSGRMTKIAPSGAPILVYSLDEKTMTVCAGTGTPAEPVTVVQEKNPCVKVEIMAPTQNRNAAPGYSIEGAACSVTYTNEKLFEGSEDSWNASVWALMPVALNDKKETPFRIKLKSVTAPFAVRVTVLAAIDSGIALAARPAVFIQR